MTNDRIYLSAPHVGARERELLLDAFDSGWVAPLGPHVDALEAEFRAHFDGRDVAALSSGTAALHLALLLAGVEAGDEVLMSTLTFVATANAVMYTGARPTFIDSDRSSWNIDPELLSASLEERANQGRLPAAVVAVDLYGQCADYDLLGAACEQYAVPLISDAAEALGATYRGRPAGSLGDSAVMSFNGNKIITTSGGGLLVSDAETVARARHLATQAKLPYLHYEHEEVGFNYRMSNLLAAVGRGQLESLPGKVKRRRDINRVYRESLSGVEGLRFMPEADYGIPTSWLTVVQLDESRHPLPHEVCRRMAEFNIECRPAWKPMHQQPIFDGCETVGGTVADEVFRTGLCLPSGSRMTEAQHARVIDALLGALG
jgi:dTDP-4-amino-4,6-dideoxygalactose transaminase